jgi:hypothetical protein
MCENYTKIWHPGAHNQNGKLLNERWTIQEIAPGFFPHGRAMNDGNRYVSVRDMTCRDFNSSCNYALSSNSGEPLLRTATAETLAWPDHHGAQGTHLPGKPNPGVPGPVCSCRIPAESVCIVLPTKESWERAKGEIKCFGLSKQPTCSTCTQLPGGLFNLM